MAGRFLQAGGGTPTAPGPSSSRIGPHRPSFTLDPKDLLPILDLPPDCVVRFIEDLAWSLFLI